MFDAIGMCLQVWYPSPVVKWLHVVATVAGWGLLLVVGALLGGLLGLLFWRLLYATAATMSLYVFAYRGRKHAGVELARVGDFRAMGTVFVQQFHGDSGGFHNSWGVWEGPFRMSSWEEQTRRCKEGGSHGE